MDYQPAKRYSTFYEGTFPSLDPAKEEDRVNNFSKDVVHKILQPKMKRTVEVKKEGGKKGETEMISETIMGKKLPPFKKIDTEQGFGMGNFFETYF